MVRRRGRHLGVADNGMDMSAAERVAEVLDAYFDSVRKDGYIVDGVTGAEATAAVLESSSWDLLMALLDRHYPEDIFPTMEDRDDRDSGPRIVSLIRHLRRPAQTPNL